MLQITGSASAPSKSSFGTVSWTDNNGAQSKNSSAATYSTSGNTATWSWSYSYGTYNVSPFTNGIIFTFTDVASAVGYDTGTSGTGYSSGGSLSSSSIGSLGTLVSIGYGYGAFSPGWYFSIAITGASVAPAQSSLSSVFDGGSNTFYTSSGAIYSTSGTTAYWSWNNKFLSNPWTATDTYDTVFTLGGTYTGFDDGSDAGGEDLPAIGSVGTTTITGVGTLNATYYYYDSVRGNTYLRVIISNTAPPTQSSLTSVQVAFSGTVWPTSSAAYSTYGSAAIWEWLANYGDVIPIAAGNSYDLNFVINSPYIGFDDGSNAGGDTLPALGSMTGTVSFGTFNSFAYYESGGSYYLQVVITGSATAPAQDAFASIGFRDVTSTARVYYTLDATYATDSKTATWTWGVGAFGFGNADVYDVTMTLSSQPWVGYDDGTITDPGGEGSSFGSITGLPAPFSFSAAINAIEQTVVGLSPNAVTQFQIIATGSAVPPPQYAFSQVTVTDSSSTIIFNLSAAAATYEVNGLSSIWTWTTVTGVPDIQLISGNSYSVTFLQPNYAGYDDGTGASGYGFPAFGSIVSAATPIGTINAIEAVSTQQVGGLWQNVLTVAITGASALTQSDLESVAYTNSSSMPEVFQSSAATFLANGNTGIWTWIISTTAVPDTEFANSTAYSVSLTFGQTIGVGTVRGMHQMQGVLYVVIGQTLYSSSADGALTQIATGIGGQDFVRMADNTACLVILLPNTITAYTYCPNDTSGAPLFQPLATAGFVEYGAIDVWYDQSYFCFLMLNGRGFFNDDGLETSGQGQITFANGNVFGRENGTDLLVGGAVDHLEVMLFGTLTSEGFLNAGVSPGDPFQAAPSSFIEQGCDPACGFTIAKQDQSIFWVANDRTIRRRNGQTPQRVSNSGIEAILENANLTGCYALTPTIAGHPNYILVIPEEGRNLAYDCLTQQWWEPFSLNNNGTWRPLCYASAYGKQLVGDSQSAQIGYLDTTTYTEWGAPLFSEFVTQAIYSNNDRFTMRRVELVITTGYAITPETIPQITLYISDDSGKTYYAREMDGLGLEGQRAIRCFWTNLGQSRCRVLKWRISDPTPSFAVQATAVLEGGRW